ncbi:MAG: hypothetical protein J6W29_08585 [Neisseriaceae bacterium]|nr:hypothetical protein [Neisseriaceae bacterium]
MSRRTFAEILASAKIDISEEYERLYNLFYNSHFYSSNSQNNYDALYKSVDKRFKYFPNNIIRKNCLNLEEFHEKFEEFNFPEYTDDINIFITFCEYLTNILKCQKDILENIIKNKKQQRLRIDEEQYFCGNISIINEQITYAIEQMGYMSVIEKDNPTIFIPKSPEAIAVAESNIIPDNLTAYEILKYYHHSLQGNIQEKKQILLKLADILEPKRKKISEESNLFCLLNSLNIRHNNITKNDKNYKPYVAQMSDKELEEWYDITYRMCLLAVLELEYQDEYHTKIDTLKKQLLVK